MAAPEVLLGFKWDHMADVWSLGVSVIIQNVQNANVDHEPAGQREIVYLSIFGHSSENSFANDPGLWCIARVYGSKVQGNVPR